MPSEQQQRPPLNHRTSSAQSQTNSPSTSPAPHIQKKSQKHIVGGNSRKTSSKALHKLPKAHGESHTDLKKLVKGGGGSATNLKKNSSHVSLKRNKSSGEIKRPKSSHGPKGSVHFEIGDQEDGWEEASSSASPALSRSASRTASHPASAKSSANNSRPQSPTNLPPTKSQTGSDGQGDAQKTRHSDGKIITERLLQRTPSHNTTKMSLTTATPMGHSPDSLGKSHSAITPSDTPQSNREHLTSRFVGGSGTPSEASTYLSHRRSEAHERRGSTDDVKRAKSMGNLTRADGEDEDSALAPRSRKSSTSHAYIPPQQSRTQQKLWLQRASSNIEPKQLAVGGAINGLGGAMNAPPSLVGAGYDGHDPRIKLQLERTGLEYLVVRRHQDPVGKSLKRLDQLPGAEKHRRIPSQSSKKGERTVQYGLSQSLKESRRGGKDRTGTAPRSSFEVGSQDSGALVGEDDGVGAILRSLWEKSFDMSASAD